MDNADTRQVIAETQELLGLKSSLAYIDDDFLAKRAEVIRSGQARSVLPGTYTGNHFVKVGREWSWEDKVGSQCGRKRVWKYTAESGSSVREVASCPEGYPWVEIITF